MGWIIAFGIVLFLAVLPLGVSVRYDAGGARVRVICGPVKFTVFPMPKKEKKEKPKKPSKTKQPSPEQAPETEGKPLPKPPQSPKEEKPKEKKGGSLLDFVPLVKVALDFLGDFRRKLRVEELYLRLILAASDPCDLAVNYGRAWAAVGNLMPQLERLFVLRKRDVEVECDFTASDTLVIARVDLTMTLGRLLSLAVGYGIRALKEFIHIRNKRKGGAEK